MEKIITAPLVMKKQNKKKERKKNNPLVIANTALLN
jgi:hypothetical protein